MKAFVSIVRRVLDKVLTTISRYNMLRPGDRVVAAVSGGRGFGVSVAGAVRAGSAMLGATRQPESRT